MIPIERLSIGLQYWFYCENFKVYGRYEGLTANTISLYDAYIYFTQSKNRSFCIEQYFLLDARKIIDIKINDKKIIGSFAKQCLADKNSSIDFDTKNSDCP